MANELFAKFDADNNGTIDKEEAKEIFMMQLRKSGSALIRFNEERFLEWFNAADENKDGVISHEEA